MFRNVYYDPFKGVAKVRAWDEKGKRIEYDASFEPYYFVEHPAGTHTSIYNTTLKKLSFKNIFERKKQIESSNVKRVFENLGADQQFILDRFQGASTLNPLKICYLDIETYYRIYHPYKIIRARKDGEEVKIPLREMHHYPEVWDVELNDWISTINSCYQKTTFPNPKEAAFPVSLITAYDSLTGVTHTWGLVEKYDTKDPNRIYHICKDEKDLFQQFMKYWISDYPDVISGWNVVGYDIPYLVNRGKKLFNEEWTKKFSPYGDVKGREFFDKNGNESHSWDLGGISVMDYMEVYRNFAMGDRESWSLAYISEYELGESKLELKHSDLVTVADTSWEEYVDYNIQDVLLLPKLEEKLRYLERSQLLAYQGACNLQRTLGKVAVITGALALQARSQGQIIPTFERDVNSLDLTLPGGYVKEPESGHRKAVISFDVNSLYPNTIVTLNISPETKVGKVLEGGDLNRFSDGEEVTLQLTNGKEHSILVKDLKQLLKQRQLSFSKAGVLYNQKKKGIMGAFVERLYAERVELRKKVGKLKSKKKKTKEEEKEMRYCDSMQYTIKILLNSLYGAQANRFFKMVDIDNATSITKTGQQVAKAGAEILNQYAKEKYGVTGDITIYQDTDSIYVTIQPILDLMKISLMENDQITEEASKVIQDLDEKVNEGITKWAQEELFSISSALVFKREAIACTGVFVRKKRYLINIRDQEGEPCNKLKAVGVEIVRTSTPKAVRELMKKVVQHAVVHYDRKSSNEILLQCFDAFKQLPPEEIAIRFRANNLKKWEAGNTGFTQFIKGTPGHVKAALSYNRLLKTLDLEGKYPKIQSGQKIKIVPLQKNIYGIEDLGFISSIPPEFNLQVDYEASFKKIVESPLSSIYEALNWRILEINKQVQTELLDLFS